MAQRKVALNPTVAHETYHTLVFKMKWEPSEVSKTLLEVPDDTNVLFLNQTKDTTRIGLKFAEKYALGGKDALILANFLNPSIAEFKTIDKELIRLHRVEHARRRLTIRAAYPG